MMRVYFPDQNNGKVQDISSIDKEVVYSRVLQKAITDMNASHLFKEIYKLKTAV